MNGTVAPSSSKPMAATTCVALAAISVALSWAICCSTDMRESASFDDIRPAGTAGGDRGCTRICGVDDRPVPANDREGVVWGAGGPGRVMIGGSRRIQKKKSHNNTI